MPLNPNRDTCPPGLLGTADLIARVPERTADIITVERERRQLERLNISVDRRRYSWHPLSVIKFLFISGGLAFVISWSAGTLLDFLKLYDQTVSKANAIPSVPGTGFAVPSINAMVPGASGLFSALPHIGIAESLYAAAVAVIILALVWGIIMFVHREKIALLTRSAKRVDEELRVLEEWRIASSEA
jgi:hypothetical protein